MRSRDSALQVCLEVANGGLWLLECGSWLLLLSGQRLELVALGETNFRACYEGEVRREKRPVYLNLAKGEQRRIW
jgi:hypothetical protein